MELLFDQAGLRTRDLYGTYDLSPYDLHAPRMIFVAGVTPSRRPQSLRSLRQERPSG